MKRASKVICFIAAIAVIGVALSFNPSFSNQGILPMSYEGQVWTNGATRTYATGEGISTWWLNLGSSSGTGKIILYKLVYLSNAYTAQQVLSWSFSYNSGAAGYGGSGSSYTFPTQTTDVVASGNIQYYQLEWYFNNNYIGYAIIYVQNTHVLTIAYSATTGSGGFTAAINSNSYGLASQPQTFTIFEGTYTVSVSRTGCQTQTQTVSLLSDQTLTFSLSPATYGIQVFSKTSTGSSLSGCTFVLSGNGITPQTLSGSSSGSAVTFSALGAGTYTCAVSHSGYFTNTGTVTIPNSWGNPMYLNVALTPWPSYSLVILTNPTGSTVAVTGYGSKTSDSSGYATFSVISGSYSVTVSKTGYTSATVPVIVNNQSKTVIFVLQSLTPASYTLTIATTPSDCTVTIGSTTKTSTGGFASFLLQAGSYAVQVSKTGYYPVSQNINVTGNRTAPITLQIITYDLVISTSPTNCSVTLSGVSTQDSGASGQVVFANLMPGIYTLTVSKFGYQTTTRTIVIGQDTTVNIALSPSEGSGGGVAPIPPAPPTNYTPFILIGLAAIIIIAFFVLRKKKR